MTEKVFLVDDEPDMLSTCEAALRGLSVVVEADASRALARLRREDFDLLVADIKMPEVTGIDLLKAAREIDPDLPVILMTGYPEVATAVEALRAGALDYLIKPFHPDDLRLRVRRALEQRRRQRENRLLSRHLGRHYKPVEIVGETRAIRTILELVDRVAPTPADVLILGESGTGKELIARRLHATSGRRGRFVPVECGAIPENLLETELFGRNKTACAGATSATPGLLELAEGGTFFLDEVADLPLSTQATLLRVLQERQYRRVGGRELRRADIRVIAATHRNLREEVTAGRFRDDLYHCLNVIAIHLPPLRERREDIPLLVRHLLPRLSRELGKDVRDARADVYEVLAHYAWPGNIRELENVLKKSIVVAAAGTLRVGDLPAFVVEAPAAAGATVSAEGFAALKKRQAEAFEKDYFASLLRKHAGNARAAARAADLPLSNFYWYLKKHGLRPQAFRT